MAKIKTHQADEAASTTADEARALVYLPALGVLAGEIVKADPETVAALVASGQADAHPDAVAYAKTLKD